MESMCCAPATKNIDLFFSPLHPYNLCCYCHIIMYAYKYYDVRRDSLCAPFFSRFFFPCPLSSSSQ